MPNEPLGEHSADRATVPPPIGGTGHGTGDTVPRHGPQETKEPPPSDPPLFGDGVEVEGEKTPEQPSSDGNHKLTEEEYAETWRKRRDREAARIREEGIE